MDGDEEICAVAQAFPPSIRHKEDVVISGVACRLPQSDNMDEFRQHLLNKDDMVTEDNSRWEPGFIGVPRRHAKLKDITKFDALFFGVSPKQANVMDPGLRIFFECVYESIVDAGINPTKLKGSRTGVYVGCGSSEALEGYSKDVHQISGYELSGCQRTMLANRISFFFDLHGPSMVVDTACSSSLLALDIALQDIRTGRCDRAIVGGVRLCLNPIISLQFDKLGVLSADGSCKSCDASANGFCRGEGIQSVFLQKQPDARRVYATVVHSKNNCDGFKERGIMFPSREVQRSLMEQVYQEAHLNPTDVNYVEAHATGTKAGDPQELSAIADVFRPEHKETPLYISCVKSSIGHLEETAGLASVAKAIISMEDHVIPSNLHYKEPNPGVEKLVSGELKPVAEHTPWPGGYCAINSIGWGGSNVHAVLRSNEKEKTRDHPAAGCERLFTFSARTEQGLKDVFAKMQEHSGNVELQALLQENADTNPTEHPYRGYVVLNASQHISDIQKCEAAKRPVWFVMTGMGAQWPKMGQDMMRMEAFGDSIRRSDTILRQVDYNLCDMLLDGEDDVFNTPMNSFLGLVAIQIALIDVLKAVGIEPDGMLGHSVGELACAYADGSMTATETLLTTYYRGKCVVEYIKMKGGMAAIGLSWEETKSRLPESLYAACHNTKDTQTISGPVDKVADFVATLQEENVFAKQVNSSGIAFHSPYMEPALGPLEHHLKSVLETPRRKRSSAWISTSVPEKEWDTDVAQFVGPEYVINNLRNPVLFQEALQKIPKNALIVEIGAHGLLLPMLRRAGLGSDVSLHSLMKRNHNHNLEFLLSTLGRLYQLGLNFNPLNMHPEVAFPVSRGTPMISPLIKWDHSLSFDVPKADSFVSSGDSAAISKFELDLSEGGDHEYLRGNVVGGQNLMPAAGLIELAWRACAKAHGRAYREFPVAVEDFRIHRETLLNDTAVSFEASLVPVEGHLEISERGELVATCRVTPAPQPVFRFPYEQEAVSNNGLLDLDLKDINKHLINMGYNYVKDFQGMVELSNRGDHGYLRWQGNWTAFIETVMQVKMFKFVDRSLRVPTGIGSLRIDPRSQEQFTEEREHGKACRLLFDHDVDVIRCGGVEIFDCQFRPIPRSSKTEKAATLQHVEFVPHVEEDLYINDAALSLYANLCEALSYKELVKRQGNGQISLSISLKNGIRDKGISEIPLEECQNDVTSPGTALLKHLTKSHSQTSQLFLKDKLLNCLLRTKALKTTFDIVAENSLGNPIRVCEYVGNGQGQAYAHYVPQTSMDVLLELEVRVFGKSLHQLTESPWTKQDIVGTTWDLRGEAPTELTCADLVVASYVLSSEEDVCSAAKKLSSLLKDDGFLLLHEPTKNFSIPLLLLGNGDCCRKDGDIRTAGPFCSENAWEKIFSEVGFEMVAKKSDGLLSTLFLFRKLNPETSAAEHVTIDISDITSYGWVEETKNAILESRDRQESSRIWLRVDAPQYSGLVGMLRCLRLEPLGDQLRCILNASFHKEAPLDLREEGLRRIVRKDLVMNVFRDGSWGSFRHLKTAKGVGEQTTQTEFGYIKQKLSGDLSRFHWCELPTSKSTSMKEETPLCKVYYSSLAQRDIKYASGKLQPVSTSVDLADPGGMFGMNWAGRNPRGQRVFGVLPGMSLATVVQAPTSLMWPCPEKWTLAEASTIPVAYSTAYYALLLRGNVQKGDCVLVHSGASAVGQAVIAIALSHGCRIFTTCSSREQKDYLKKRFPQLDEECFASSRNDSFRIHILQQTKGRGCDLVLNSLDDDKLHESLRCVAKHGTFIELDNYNSSSNLKRGLDMLPKTATICGVQIDAVIDKDNRQWPKIHDLISKGIKDGVVAPLHINVFEADKVQEAFQIMACGIHIGEVVIKIRKEEEHLCSLLPSTVTAITRASCSPRKTYIITGGLGGFGLELSYWLLERGCRHLLLTSRSGVTTGYQSRMLRVLKEQGMDVRVLKRDVGIKDEADALVHDADEIAPLGGVFHLAMVLDDRLLEGHSPDTFRRVCHPKVNGAINLDSATRNMCTESLDWFVTFSSISSGHGNPGQSNYAFANSFMERLCEQRKHDGLPALAIQWGPIADAGVFFERNGEDNNAEVAGAIPQSIPSCLNTLDHFLQQDKPVVSSWVVADKTAKHTSSKMQKGNLLSIVSDTLGLANLDSIHDSVTLSAFGIDSLMGVHIQQAIHDCSGFALSIEQIRKLTIRELREIYARAGERKGDENSETTLQVPIAKLLGMKPEKIMPKRTLVTLNEGPRGCNKPPIFMMCPMNGTGEMLEDLASYLDRKVYAVQSISSEPNTCILDVVGMYMKVMRDAFPEGPYHIAGYSYGAVTGCEVACQLQLARRPCSLILLDAGPSVVSFRGALHSLHCKIPAEADSHIIISFVMLYTLDNHTENRQRIFRQTTLQDRIKEAVSIIHEGMPTANEADIAAAAQKYYDRMGLGINYKPSVMMRCPVTLIKSAEDFTGFGEPFDFSVGQYCTKDVDIYQVPGDHITFVHGDSGRQVAKIIQKALDKEE